MAKTITKTSTRRLTPDTVRTATMKTRTGKRKTVIKTSLVDSNHTNRKTNAEGYKTKIKYNKAGGVKSAKTKKMSQGKTIRLI